MENKTIINSSGNNSEVQSAANAAHVTERFQVESSGSAIASGNVLRAEVDASVWLWPNRRSL